jgi:hypothetical protein
MKLKKLSILMGVGLMTYLSTLGQTNLIKTEASLTPPSNYHINYSHNTTDDRYFLYTSSLGSSTNGADMPKYTRTTDSSFFNYSTTLNNFNTGSILPDGLEITMTFNRSNTTWTKMPNPSQLYFPSGNSIGSDSTVGSVNKLDFTFNNQTSKNYRLTLDFSSTTFNNNFYVSYGSNIWFTFIGFSSTLSENNLYIPAYSSLRLYRFSSTSQVLFDSWYLQDLGINGAVQEGYDEGYQDGLNNNPNILLSGFQAMVGILINMALMVLNLSVFGVSLLDIFAIMALLVGIVWILKLVRG